MKIGPFDDRFKLSYKGRGDTYYWLKKDCVYYADSNYNLFNEFGNKIKNADPAQSYIPPCLFKYINNGDVFINNNSRIEHWPSVPIYGIDLQPDSMFMYYIKANTQIENYNSIKCLHPGTSIYMIDTKIYYATLINNEPYLVHNTIIRELVTNVFDSAELHKCRILTTKYIPSTSSQKIGKFTVWVDEYYLGLFDNGYLYYCIRNGAEYIFALMDTGEPIAVYYNTN